MSTIETCWGDFFIYNNLMEIKFYNLPSENPTTSQKLTAADDFVK
jgi:hypothetical protein